MKGFDEIFSHVADEKCKDFLVRPDFITTLDECGEILDRCEQHFDNDTGNKNISPVVLHAREDALDDMREALGLRDTEKFREATRDFFNV